MMKGEGTLRKYAYKERIFLSAFLVSMEGPD
jgi:hypothetical protein